VANCCGVVPHSREIIAIAVASAVAAMAGAVTALLTIAIKFA